MTKLVALAALVVTMMATVSPAQEARIRRVGYLDVSRTPEDRLSQRIWAAYTERLRELGWVEGRNFVLETRFANYDVERLPALAVELVEAKVEVIAAAPNTAVAAAKNATTTIPIVMIAANAPVEVGFIADLRRPGGNVTGVTFDVGAEIWGKRLELLKAVVPQIKRVAGLVNPTLPGRNAQWQAATDATRILGLVLQRFEYTNASQLEQALAHIARARPQGLMIFGDPLIFYRRAELAEFAAKHRLPTIYPFSECVEAGGLMSYAADLAPLWRRAAEYVDRILRGAKPGDLPVERPTKFDLVLNLKTAKALGLTIPPSLLARADQVIE